MRISLGAIQQALRVALTTLSLLFRIPQTKMFYSKLVLRFFCVGLIEKHSFFKVQVKAQQRPGASSMKHFFRRNEKCLCHYWPITPQSIVCCEADASLNGVFQWYSTLRIGNSSAIIIMGKVQIFNNFHSTGAAFTTPHFLCFLRMGAISLCW